MPVFPLLASPHDYVACNWDLRVDDAGRTHWLRFFVSHLETIFKLAHAAETFRGADPAAVEFRTIACRAEFHSRFADFGANFAHADRVTILTLDRWRDEILRRHGFTDAFVDLKARENANMLPLLPTVLTQLDTLLATDPAAHALALVEGVFAGNIFDMGAEATAKAFLGASPDFFATRAKLTPRPWRIDDFDLLAPLLTSPPWRKAVYFVDNAGSDILLGAIPFIRHLARAGCRVVVAANERPSLNDVTIHELRALWPAVIAADPSIASLPIELVTSGTGEPLIDLSDVSAELCHASLGADLCVLEGMGRGVESNLDADLTCDRLNLAMLKDAVIARRHGGEVFDCVCRFVPSTNPRG